MTRHTLKIDPHWFDRLANGSKTAEVRKHDRDFQIGDTIAFVEDNWGLDGYPATRRVIEATVSHILPASVFESGLQPGYSVLSLVDLGDVREVEEGVQP